MKALLAYTVVLGVLLAAPAMAQWQEQGDAGDLPGSAQIPVGGGPLTTITGSLLANDADMYCIRIDTPSFVIQTCTGTSFDSQLFLFREDGIGVGMNDDTSGCGSFNSRISTITAGCPNFSGPGQYLVAVSRFNRDPLNAAAQLLWAAGTNEKCPDGPGAATPVASWSGTTSAGTYTITMTGVSYCGATAVEPSTWGSIKNIYK